MIVIEVNVGPKIEYEVNNTKITFDDELMLNLKKYEQDDPVEIDICADKNGNLTTAISWRTVAQIEIPARQYEEVEGENGLTLEPVPFDMNRVTLKLYSLD
ncbi:MAG: hypothetical protein IJM27_03925 [Eubacterium sp.]|nr:hypothetical protein [Eubacterium sp.]